MWISIFQEIDELVCSKKTEFAVLFLGFEKLGLEIDNCGRTTENAYCRIYSLWFDIQLIDYKCENGRFPESRSWVAVSNPKSLSSSAAEFMLGHGAKRST